MVMLPAVVQAMLECASSAVVCVAGPFVPEARAFRVCACLGASRSCLRKVLDNVVMRRCLPYGQALPSQPVALWRCIIQFVNAYIVMWQLFEWATRDGAWCRLQDEGEGGW
jgi:hypothetical protein